MSEADIEYRGHFIDVQSHESDGKQWRPKAVVSIYHGGVLHQKTVAAPIEVLSELGDSGGHLLAWVLDREHGRRDKPEGEDDHHDQVRPQETHLGKILGDMRRNSGRKSRRLGALMGVLRQDRFTGRQTQRAAPSTLFGASPTSP